jgi:hypothetical protein
VNAEILRLSFFILLFAGGILAAGHVAARIRRRYARALQHRTWFRLCDGHIEGTGIAVLAGGGYAGLTLDPADGSISALDGEPFRVSDLRGFSLPYSEIRSAAAWPRRGGALVIQTGGGAILCYTGDAARGAEEISKRIGGRQDGDHTH